MSVRRAGRFLCTTKPPQSVNDPKGGLGGAHASKGQREILETGAAAAVGLFFLMNFSNFVESLTLSRALFLHWKMFLELIRRTQSFNQEFL